jgi:hypothetical protein
MKSSNGLRWFFFGWGVLMLIGAVISLITGFTSGFTSELYFAAGFRLLLGLILVIAIGRELKPWRHFESDSWTYSAFRSNENKEIIVIRSDGVAVRRRTGRGWQLDPTSPSEEEQKRLWSPIFGYEKSVLIDEVLVILNNTG